MARRIGLAQAMINDPDFLILDEPTSGLDPIGCKEVKDLILMLKKRGKTVLITSHLLSDVEDICDRVIILYGGKVRAQGSMNELLTVSDSTRLTIPTLNGSEMESVLADLRKHLHGEEIKVDHPRISLEDYFLNIIEKARQESVATSGVVGGGKIADYLSDDSNAVLDSLTQEAKSEKAEVKEEKTAAVEVDKSQLLKELTGEKEKVDAEVIASQIKEEQRQALEEADSKLDELLKDK